MDRKRRNFLRTGAAVLASAGAGACGGGGSTPEDAGASKSASPSSTPATPSVSKKAGFPLQIDFTGLCAYLPHEGAKDLFNVGFVNYNANNYNEKHTKPNEQVPKHIPALVIPKANVASATKAGTASTLIQKGVGVDGFTFRNGPWLSGKLLVFRTWRPALCSPLKGVTTAGQPAACAASGESNQRPRWYIWIGSNGGLRLASGNGPLNTTGAGALPGATAKVSILNLPTKR